MIALGHGQDLAQPGKQVSKFEHATSETYSSNTSIAKAPSHTIRVTVHAPFLQAACLKKPWACTATCHNHFHRFHSKSLKVTLPANLLRPVYFDQIKYHINWYSNRVKDLEVLQFES
jgi:hypothetical protein